MVVKGKMLFHWCLLGAQEYGSNDEYMVSRIYFSLVFPDRTFDNLFTDIKQTVGDDFETCKLEINPPPGLKLKLDYFMFRDAVELYFRSLIGKQGKIINIKNSKNINFVNLAFQMPMESDIIVNVDKGGW